MHTIPEERVAMTPRERMALLTAASGEPGFFLVPTARLISYKPNEAARMASENRQCFKRSATRCILCIGRPKARLLAGPAGLETADTENPGRFPWRARQVFHREASSKVAIIVGPSGSDHI